MQEMTRRAALRGTAAVAAVAAVPSAFANTNQDADLETWEAQIPVWEQRFEGVDDEDAQDAILDQMAALEWKIARAETTRPLGLAVKVRRVGFHEGGAEWDQENIRTLLTSLERMEG